MPTYAVWVSEPSGEASERRVVAASSDDARARLVASGLLVLRVTRVADEAPVPPSSQRPEAGRKLEAAPGAGPLDPGGVQDDAPTVRVSPLLGRPAPRHPRGSTFVWSAFGSRPGADEPSDPAGVSADPGFSRDSEAVDALPTTYRHDPRLLSRTIHPTDPAQTESEALDAPTQAVELGAYQGLPAHLDEAPPTVRVVPGMLRAPAEAAWEPAELPTVRLGRLAELASAWPSPPEPRMPLHPALLGSGDEALHAAVEEAPELSAGSDEAAASWVAEDASTPWQAHRPGWEQEEVAAAGAADLGPELDEERDEDLDEEPEEPGQLLRELQAERDAARARAVAEQAQGSALPPLQRERAERGLVPVEVSGGLAVPQGQDALAVAVEQAARPSAREAAEKDATSRLERLLDRVVEVQMPQAVGWMHRLFKPQRKGGRIDPVRHALHVVDRITFFGCLSNMLATGIPLVRAMKALEAQFVDPGTQAVVAYLLDGVQRGEELSKVMEELPRSFSRLQMGSVRGAERTGALGEVLDRLRYHDERSLSLTRQLKAQMTYPVVVFACAVLLVLFVGRSLLIGVVPVLEQARIETSWTTSAIILLGKLMDNPLGILVGLLLGWLGGRRLWRWVTSEVGKAWCDRFVMTAPGVGRTMRTVETVRFCEGLATLYGSGLPILECLDIVRGATGNIFVAQMIANMRRKMRDGRPLSECMAEEDLFSPTVIGLVYVGEESGSLERSFASIARFSDMEVRHCLESFAVMIEPVMMMVLGIMVSIIALVAFAPLYQVIATL